MVLNMKARPQFPVRVEGCREGVPGVGMDPYAHYAEPRWWNRKLEQAVVHAPIEPGEPFGPNQSHSEVCGDKSQSIRRKLRDSAKLVWQK
jgi:hypothetical protein